MYGIFLKGFVSSHVMRAVGKGGLFGGLFLLREGGLGFGLVMVVLFDFK